MSRMEKVNQQIRREISRILQQEMSDPRLEFVSILEVRTSKDLKTAKIYFSVLGDSKKAEEAEKTLNGARGFIRKYLGAELNMRYTPDLNFIFDNSLEQSARIENAIKEIHDES